MKFFIACGFVSFDENRIYGLDRISLNDKDQKEKFLKWRQSGPLPLMDALLGQQSRGSIMKTPLLLTSGSSPISKLLPAAP